MKPSQVYEACELAGSGLQDHEIATILGVPVTAMQEPYVVRELQKARAELTAKLLRVVITNAITNGDAAEARQILKSLLGRSLDSADRPVSPVLIQRGSAQRAVENQRKFLLDAKHDFEPLDRDS